MTSSWPYLHASKNQTLNYVIDIAIKTVAKTQIRAIFVLFFFTNSFISWLDRPTPDTYNLADLIMILASSTPPLFISPCAIRRGKLRISATVSCETAILLL